MSFNGESLVTYIIKTSLNDKLIIRYILIFIFEFNFICSNFVKLIFLKLNKQVLTNEFSGLEIVIVTNLTSHVYNGVSVTRAS